MPNDPFPDPGPGDEEPEDLSFPPEAEWAGPDDDEDFPAQQGLYVSLPAEQLNLAGFAQNGEADTMAPGGLLATVVQVVTGEDGTGLAGCSDDQLVGILSAARRLESRAAWTQLAAMAEFSSRRPSRRGRGGGTQAEFAADELASELHVTGFSAANQIDFASSVSKRLPKTFAALYAGLIHPVHLRIIEDETSILSAEDAAHADEVLALQAPGLTFGELRYAARKLILKLDPEAVRKRKEAARQEAHVRRFREGSGNAGMVARELPSDEILASWQHVEQRALDLRAAGMPGTLEELRVQAYLDLLQERDSRAHADDPVPADPVPADRGTGTGRAASPGSDQVPPGDEPPAPDSGGPASGLGRPGPGPGGSGPARSPDAGPSLAAVVTITVPAATLRGESEIPGEADGFGLLDGDDARSIVAAAARHVRTRWCITALNPDGTAAAHVCLSGRHPPPGLGPPGTGSPGTGSPGTGPPFLLPVMMPITRAACDHPHAEIGYHPSRKLAHLVRARNARCTARGCSRPAARCDLDHTIPWDQGGPTCECDLAPLCRHHHRCKQAHGWHLDQPQPGVLIWRVPSGRTYTTAPTTYPV